MNSALRHKGQPSHYLLSVETSMNIQALKLFRSYLLTRENHWN